MHIALLFFLVITSQLSFGMEPGEEFDFRRGRPSNAQLETVARVALTHMQRKWDKYFGMDLIVETRDRATQRYLWFADIRFTAENPNHAGASTYGSSSVKVEYCAPRDYFRDGSVLHEDKPPIRLFHVNRNMVDLVNSGKDLYKECMRRSILEFKLENILEVRDLCERIKAMEIIDKGWIWDSKELPMYSLAGYAYRAKAWNCSVFTAALLEKLGVNVCSHNPTHNNVLRDLVNFNYGYVKGMTSLGAIVGGGIGCVGGPVGAAIGVVVGGALFCGGQTIKTLSYDAVYPSVVIDELLHNHANLNIRPKFVIPSGGIHTLHERDDLYVARKQYIDDDKSKYDKWYKNFVGPAAPLRTHTAEYPPRLFNLR